MTKRMLIDSTHAEETRVVVLDGSRLEDFDVETSTKRQLKGNIYLAKVVRVEPSLQAAFVEYGGNRHGFLAFSEIHPDYYQIPVADRQRLIEMQAEEARREEEEEDRAALADGDAQGETAPSEPMDAELDAETVDAADTIDSAAASPGPATDHVPAAQPARIETDTVGAAVDELHDFAVEPMRVVAASAVQEPDAALPEPELIATTSEPVSDAHDAAAATTEDTGAPSVEASPADAFAIETADSVPEASTDTPFDSATDTYSDGESLSDAPPPETVGGDADTVEDSHERRIPPRFLRNYKIQEVIRRRQILLIQVVKEERGTKGAALTTYISLAGRYCVLMPNSPRGGGISRKITSATDRRRLKEVMTELDIPNGMGLIVRTAGANRPKPEIKRDCEYLLRLWDDIRDHTMKSVAPALIYEEASLIKRAIRDVYSRDIDEILVDGEDGWKAARDFMRMLMPSHVKKVQLWRDSQSLFGRQQVEAQLDAMLSPTVQLRSGGYLVINQTEALVAIDVNSGRSTRERGIEETALRTNSEAADEVARQLRLRDLAGLIVIDFIDMEARKNNAIVERRLKEALKNDRARIQVGHISHFGLMEMSRQRLRPSLAETSFVTCPHCGGTGHVRGTESAAIHVLRDIEEEGAKRRAAEIMVRVAAPVAMYILNHKRARLAEIEARYEMHVTFTGDDTLIPPQVRIDRVRAQVVTEVTAVTPDAPQPHPEPALAHAEPAAIESDDDVEDDDDVAEGAEADDEQGEPATSEEAERRRRRRRRRRRGGRREDAVAPATEGAPPAANEPPAVNPTDLEEHIEGVPEHAEAPAEAGGPEAGTEDDGRGRRRGRRGGRRRRRDGTEGPAQPFAEPGADQPDLAPLYAGPTPADPFGGQAFDIFDVLERAEQEADRQMAAPPVVAAPEPAPVAVPDVVVADLIVTTTPQPAPEPEAVAEPGPVSDPEPVVEQSHEPVAAPEAMPIPEPAPKAVTEVVAEAPVQLAPANDTAPEPLVKPILIGGAEEPAAEKKRGWWRR
jgi:ribonuclease E